MNKKIIEWSARFIHLYARGLQKRRWYSALTPNKPSTVSPYTDVAKAATGDTVDAARLISAAAAASAPKNVQKWMCPRSRGRRSTTGSGAGSVVRLTLPGYVSVGSPAVLKSHASHRVRTLTRRECSLLLVRRRVQRLRQAPHPAGRRAASTAHRHHARRQPPL